MKIKFLMPLFCVFSLLMACAADWSEPTVFTSKDEFPLKIRELAYDAAIMEYDDATNLPTGSIKYNRDTAQLEEWNGSAWEIQAIGVPPGTLMDFAGPTAPTGYLLADGECKNRTTYAALFTVIGTTYGDCDGTTTFGLPDARQRFILGKAASGTGETLGTTGGAINHAHTISHSHDLSNHKHSVGSHTHTSGALRAAIGVDGSAQGDGIQMKLDGSYTIAGSGWKWSGGGSALTGLHTLAGSPATHVEGITGGTTPFDSDFPNPNYTGPSSDANSGTANPPYIVMNKIIKY